jgi:hypothetical protein
MNINLTPEQEKIVKEERESGRGRTVEEIVGRALRALREKGEASSAAMPDNTQSEAVREMVAFVEKNCVRLEGVSVKDLIHYA